MRSSAGLLLLLLFSFFACSDDVETGQVASTEDAGTQTPRDGSTETLDGTIVDGGGPVPIVDASDRPCDQDDDCRGGTCFEGVCMCEVPKYVQADGRCGDDAPEECIAGGGRCQQNPAECMPGELEGELQTNQTHVIASDAVQHTVVDQDRMRVVEHPLDLQLAVKHAVAVEQIGSDMDRRFAHRRIVARLQFAFGIGAAALPVAERQRQHEEEQRRQRGPYGGRKPPLANPQRHQVHGPRNPVRLKFCGESSVMRILALLFIFFILASLGSALYYLIKDKGQSERTVKMLTVRVTLSLILFIALMAGTYFGIIPPNGLR
jgi:hypothetical protein